MHGSPGRLIGLAARCVPAVLLAACQSEPLAPRILTLEVVSGTNQNGLVGGLLPQPLVVRAVDQAGNPYPGATVSWSVVTGGGTVSPTSSVTDAQGQASTTFRLGNALGSQTARASLGNAAPVVFVATAAAAPPSQLTAVSGNNQTAQILAPLAQELTVRVSDAFGNTVAGVTVGFAVLTGGGTLSSSTGLSDGAGLARVRWTLGDQAGTQQAAAAVFGVTPVVFTATALPGPAAALEIAGGNAQAAAPGSVLPDSLVVRVVDAHDNPIRDVNITWTPVGTAGTVSPASSRTDANGLAATQWTISMGGGPKEVRASASGLTPVSFQAAGTIAFASVLAGGRHTCGLDVNGSAYCWGQNADGQLGIGSLSPATAPTPVAGGFGFEQGSGGAFHTCAVTSALTARCWGRNGDGRLGTGTTAGATQPALVSGGQTFTEVQAGGTHTCALTPASRLFCWGANTDGQIGVGAAGGTFSTPAAVDPAQTWLAVAAGGLHTCAVATSGATFCFGNNAHGQLGTGAPGGSAAPAPVSGSLLATDIVAGESHSCALSAGLAFCWGRNDAGQLGDGSNNASTIPVAVAGGLQFASLSAGHSHTCGLTVAGLAYCWGLNSSGQLGNGGLTAANQPVPVGGGFTFTVLSAGDHQTCGRSTGGIVYCWGDNQSGQLGDGTQTSRTLPTRVLYQ